MRTVAFIPARGGSTSIPRKNLVQLCGKPLIAWTIEAAQRSRLLTRIVVSTDDQEIADVARQYGEPVEMRPPELCGDGPTIDVIRWHYSECSEHIDAMCCLQATCPMRRAEDIDGSIELMERTGCDSVISYVDVGANHPERMAQLDSDGRVEPFHSVWSFSPRQELPKYYLRSGDIYLVRWHVLEQGKLAGCDCRAWIIPPERHCNIDSERDLVLAEGMLSKEALCKST